MSKMSVSRKAATHPLSALADRTRARVLVADPDSDVITALRRSLRTGGYQFLATHDGQRALKLVYERRPDVLVLADRLPGLNGSHICEAIKADDTLGFLPVIMMVNADAEWYENNANGGADATLAKPVDGDELLAWLRFLLRIKRQIDRLIHENQKLTAASQELERMRSEIIDNVSHELSTPLLQVKTAVALLAEDIGQGGSHEQSRVADMAEQAVARLEGAVDNIRQLALAYNIRLSPVVLDEVSDLAIRHLERSWASRQGRGRVEKRIERDLPLVWADKRALARLLQVLLDNGIKFSPPDTRVYLFATQIAADAVRIGVQDFGIGIPPEEHARIFEAFYQVDGSSTRRYGGTGTGLALAQLLANGMKTEILVESKPGTGSIFSIELPVVDPSEYGSL